MSRIILKKGLHFWLNGREYQIIKRLSSRDFQISDIVTEATSQYSEESLYQLFFETKLTFDNPGSSNSNQNYEKADFSQIESSLQESAKRKFEYVKVYLESGLQKRTEESLKPIIEKASQTLKDNNPPHWVTLSSWIKRYNFSGGDIRSLVDKDIAKGRKTQLNVEVLSMITQIIDEFYLQLEKPNVADVYSYLIFEITRENATRQKIGLPPLKIPHHSTVYRIVNKLDPYKETIARYGRVAADKMFNTSEHLPPLATRPLEVVEIDHTKLPLYVVDIETNLPIGIPTLTTTIDRYTGIPVGYYISFEPASYLSVMQCLWHSINPKNYVKSKFIEVKHEWNCYGLMETLKVDNAPEFKGKQLEDACYQLGILLDFAPPSLAWYKAKVERFFRTISTMVLQGQPGAFLKFMKKYDDKYDPKNSAIISLDSLHEIIHIFIIDIVSQMPHPQFGTPRANVWFKAISEYPTALPSNIQDLRILLGSLTYRVISKNGVEFEGLYYRSPELTRLRHIYERRDKRRITVTKEREKAKIKFDPTDLSFVYVFDPDNHNFAAIPAVNQEYTKGLSLWQHKVIRKFASQEAEQVDIVALAIAKQKIQDIVKRDWQTSNRGRTKVSMARWLGIGRDGLDTEDVEAFHEEQISSFNKNSNHALNELSSMSGISDFGNLVNSNDDSLVTKVNVSFNNMNEACPVDNESNLNSINIQQQDTSNQSTTNKTAKKESNRKGKSRRKDNKLQVTTQDESEKTDVEKDEWKPNLSGWSVGYVQ